jgi:hypothetical protein
VFNSSFGEDIEERRRTTCVVGFEPNFNHMERLRTLEEVYNKCGWRTHFFLETAVSDHNGKYGLLYKGIGLTQINL